MTSGEAFRASSGGLEMYNAARIGAFGQKFGHL